MENEQGQLNEGQEAIPVEGQIADGAQAAPAVKDDFDPAKWPLIYKGSPVQVKDRQHLTNLAQQGYGYSQKMEELNKRGAEMDELKGKYSKYATLDEQFQQYPGLYQQIVALSEKYRKGEVSGEGEELPPEVVEVRQTKDEVKQMLDEMHGKQADEKLQQEIKELRGKYQENWDFDDGSGPLVRKVLEHAHKNNIPKLETAYRDFRWDSMQTGTKAETLKKEQERQAQLTKEGKVSGGQHQPQGAKPLDVSKLEYSDLASMAANEIEQKGG